MINQDRIKQISISPSVNLLDAIRFMDEADRKLLIVLNDEKFVGLLSLGDIQRALITNQDFTIPVAQILRKEITVAKQKQSDADVKKMMIQHRAEFMPILDDNGNLVNVLFWDELFEEERQVEKEKKDIPVVIMAGGFGTRLRPLTNIIPKPLIPLGDQTILEVIIERFKELGSQDFFLSVNYKADMIRNYFDEKNNLDVNISHFIEDKPLGTAGSLHLLNNKISTTFFVSNCDIIIDQDYRDILKYHQDNKNEITLVSVIKNFNIPYGTIEAGEGGLVKAMKEKPTFTFYINAGMYILEPHLINEIPKNEFFHITDLIDKIMKRDGRVGVFPVSEGAWSDIGEWDKYKATLNKFGHDTW